jgi:hypothetical protein
MKFLLDLWHWFLLTIMRSNMGVRENRVERYLDSEIMKLGGITRKWVSPGVNGVPDRIVIVNGLVWFVEVKTVDGVMSSWQVREIKRLNDHGAQATSVYGGVGVDEFIKVVRDAI